MDELISSSGAVKFCVQNDRNLVGYVWDSDKGTWIAFWSSNTSVSPEPKPPFIPTPDPPLPPVGYTKANYCNLYDSLHRPIFSSCLAAQYPDMQREWINWELLAGGNAYVVSIESGYKNVDLPEWYGYGDIINFYTSGRMDEFRMSLDRILDKGLTPIIFMHSGGPWPGLMYFDGILNELISYVGLVKYVPAWEPVKGDWTTLQLYKTIDYLRTRVPRDKLMLHLSRGRLSWSSNPVEADDPFGGDEIESCRWAAPYIGEFLYQSEPFQPGMSFDYTIPGSPAERAWEVAGRVLGTIPGKDWYAGLPRPVLNASETVAYNFIRGNGGSEYARNVADFFRSIGYQGFCNGVPHEVVK